MEVKSDDKRAESASASAWWEDPAQSVNGREAANLLGWENPNSVRNRAREGGLRWRRRGNGRLVFHRGDVLEYASRTAGPAPGE